ncbi:MAG: FAD-binding protein, partial [Burkholderiaceae bacterium]
IVREVPLLAARVEELEEHRAIELIPARDGSGIAGVLFIDVRQGTYRLVRARCVLLATGAGPTMYRYHTPSGDKTCDGLAMALRYGLALRDMEMVQFHPTGLLGGPDTRMTGTVLEEGLRGAGGHLLNGAGERFMLNVDARGERATRDVVSRGIYAEMRAGRTGPMGGVYIAMGHLGPDMVRRKFPGMVKRCEDCGFDLAAGRVEIVPTAHYMMGGVEFEVDGSTASPGLYAAGEDCGVVHGANRLGGNGVANSTVFGGIAGDSMAAFARTQRLLREPDALVIDAAIARVEFPFSRRAGPSHELREALAQTMWDDVGVMRNRTAMERGLASVARHQADLRGLGVADGDRGFNLSWHDWLNLESLLDLSEVITRAALARENSRGAHFREDFPEPGSLDGSRYTRVVRRGDELQLELVPVDFSIVRPGQSLLEADHAAAGAAGADRSADCPDAAASALPKAAAQTVAA